MDILYEEILFFSIWIFEDFNDLNDFLNDYVKQT
jgi:hypothetical protein